MKVVILAAGKGSRLGDSATPKPLTLLQNGKSLLQMQIEAIEPHISLDQILIVVGFCKEKIMEKYPHLLFVYNPKYAVENTSKSLLRAVNKIDEDLLWMNGDVLFHPSILPKLFASKESCLVVNEGLVEEEEVKYRTDCHGRIQVVSKEVSNPQGEALGINFFTKRDLPFLQKGLSQCEPQDYFEKGIEWAIRQGRTILSFPVDSGLCTEIDFLEDLDRANAMLKSWKELP